MALKNPLTQVFRHAGRVVPSKLGEILTDLDTRITNVAAGVPEDGAVTEAKLANGAVVESKLGTGAVTSGKLGAGAVGTAKIADGAVTPAKMFDNYIDSAGVTITALTAAIAAPATLVDGTIYVIKDTADSNKIKLVVVAGSAFIVFAAGTAAV